MAVETIPKVAATTLSICVPKDLQDRFSEAARIISKICPNNPIVPTDLMSFTLLKETTGGLVIDFLQFVNSCDESTSGENGSGQPPHPAKPRLNHG